MFAKTKSGECALDLAVTGGRFDLFERFVDAGLSVKDLTLVMAESTVKVIYYNNLGHSAFFAKDDD